jgi:flotillin
MDPVTLLILIGVIVLIIVLVLILLSKQYRKVGPNEVLIISGGRKRTVVDPDGTKRRIGYRMHIGGGTLVLPFLESARVLPLEVYTIDMQSNEAITAKGIQINAVGQAQIKIGGNEGSIRLAAEQFLGKGGEGIRDVASKILEGHMRAALGAMSVEELFQKRDEFSSRVRQAAARDFGRMGLDILSFALKDMSDTSGYIEALGKPRIAEARTEAAVAEANAEKEATIKASEARKEADIAKFKAETEIAGANREYELKRAEFQAAINEKKAAADLSYEIERQKMNQKLKKEEYQVRLIEKEEAIKLEEKEIQRKEKELESTVKKQADARKYQLMSETEAQQHKLVSEARARAEAIKLEGEAEAETMKKKAESYSEYSQAALYEMVIKMMPELARAVSEPLSKVDKIVMIDSSEGGGAAKITRQVAEIIAQLPAVVENLSGVDLKKLLEKLPQASANKKKTGEKS